MEMGFFGSMRRMIGEKYKPVFEAEWSMMGVKRTENKPSLSLPLSSTSFSAVEPVCSFSAMHVMSDVSTVVVSLDMRGGSTDRLEAVAFRGLDTRFPTSVLSTLGSFPVWLLMFASVGLFDMNWWVCGSADEVGEFVWPVPRIVLDNELKNPKPKEGRRVMGSAARDLVCVDTDAKLAVFWVRLTGGICVKFWFCWIP